MNEEKIRKEERDNFTIVLEDLKSDFKIFGEVLGGVRDRLERVEKKGDATFEEVGKIKIELSEIKEDVSILKEDVSNIKSEMKEMNGRLDNIEFEIKSIRKEFDFLKKEFEEKGKIDIGVFKEFEKRVIKLEKHLKISTT